MWKCPKCGRVFEKHEQVHSCRTKPLEEHFANKELAREIFDFLFEKINKEVGMSKIISIPCCIHLFGKYDYLAALPKKDKLEIRFALNRTLDSPRLKQSVMVTRGSYKNCIDLFSKKDVDKELMNWIAEAYHLRKMK